MYWYERSMSEAFAHADGREYASASDNVVSFADGTKVCCVSWWSAEEAYPPKWYIFGDIARPGETGIAVRPR